MSSNVRILLVADSHLGFDYPVRPRVARRRRGHDFFANYARALEPALLGEADIVVHAGDVFDRPMVPTTVAYQALDPLRRIAERGVPVFVAPGNHERSRIPHVRFASHPRVAVFDRPRTFVAEIRGTRIALTGFPYERRDVRTQFVDLLDRCTWRREPARIRVLCMHHCVEGATVGPSDYMFTTASDVIRPREVPREFAAVLTGHIHRHQVLTVGLDGRSLHTPVVYPGSIERTSFAEMDEPKGFMMLHVEASEGDSRVRWEFRRLPARPMVRAEVNADGISAAALTLAIQRIVMGAPADAVVSMRVTGAMSALQRRAVSSARLREIVPATMNVDVIPSGGVEMAMPAESHASPDASPQLSFIE